MDKQQKTELIKNISGARLRTLLSKSQYRQFYEDIIRGYFEFLNPRIDENLQKWSWHLFIRHLNRLHQPEVPREYRKLKLPIRDNFTLQDIIEYTSHKQFFDMVRLVLDDFLDMLPPYAPFRSAKKDYFEFLGVNIDTDQLEKINPEDINENLKETYRS